jgi:hypothetical protein
VSQCVRVSCKICNQLLTNLFEVRNDDAARIWGTVVFVRRRLLNSSTEGDVDSRERIFPIF